VAFSAGSDGGRRSPEHLTAQHAHVVCGWHVYFGAKNVRRAIKLYDRNRPIGHIPRVELVKGDAVQSIPAFIAENDHTVVALLYLDFDLYEPTKAALDAFLPRMPKGAVIAFDELNQKH